MDNAENTPESPAASAITPRQEIHLGALQTMPFGQLLKRAENLHLKASPDRSRHQLILDILRFHAQKGDRVFADGILEMTSDNHGFLRWPNYNFRPCPEDVYVPAPILKRFFLRPGNRVAGYLRPPRDKEKFMALDEVISIEDQPSGTWTETKHSI